MKKDILEKLLMDQKEELSTRIKKIDENLRHRNISKKTSQQNVERANDDVLAALKEEAGEELMLTNRAIERLAKDEYGNCTECGKDISDERLKAVPFTQYCRFCAQERESA